MIADLWALAMAYPTLASVLFLIVLLVALLFAGMLASVLFLIVLLVALLFAGMLVGLRQLPPDALSELSERQALEPEHQAKCASRPLPWNRAGGNWWPVP